MVEGTPGRDPGKDEATEGGGLINVDEHFIKRLHATKDLLGHGVVPDTLVASLADFEPPREWATDKVRTFLTKLQQQTRAA